MSSTAEQLAYEDVAEAITRTRMEILSAKIEALEGQVNSLTEIQDRLLATVIEQNRSITMLIERSDILARSAGIRLVEERLV